MKKVKSSRRRHRSVSIKLSSKRKQQSLRKSMSSRRKSVMRKSRRKVTSKYNMSSSLKSKSTTMLSPMTTKKTKRGKMSSAEAFQRRLDERLNNL